MAGRYEKREAERGRGENQEGRRAIHRFAEREQEVKQMGNTRWTSGNTNSKSRVYPLQKRRLHFACWWGHFPGTQFPFPFSKHFLVISQVSLWNLFPTRSLHLLPYCRHTPFLFSYNLYHFAISYFGLGANWCLMRYSNRWKSILHSSR